ncbi:hypothetical protein [Chiayiivirga flava]|uniref:Fatty acid desaturase n=1 Tax=Chiayiivirga flava TaxID=659595 RepID=A0A7W8D4K8_9GAMM|nr:hypothetical protein [Chiayiivirga flava]MBB5207809.1 fatty acid desaturase [Chiayiivirga flava]
MNQTLIDLPAATVMLGGVLYFALLYFGVGGIAVLLTRHVLPALRYGRRIDPRRVPAAQRRRELRLSLISIVIFGVGLVVPWSVLRLGWARVA